MSAATTLGLLAGSSVLGGALAVGAVRRKVLGTLEQDWLIDRIELEGVEEDGLVTLKSGGVFRVFELHGQPFETMPLKEQQVALSVRGALLRQLGEKGLTVRLFGIKQRSRLELGGEWPSKVLEEIGRGEREAFRSAFEVRWLMILEGKSRRVVEEGGSIVLSSLDKSGARLLETPRDLGDSCEVMAACNHLVCGNLRVTLPRASTLVGGGLSGADVCVHGTGVVEAQFPDGRRFGRVIAVRRWPEEVSGMLWHRLMGIPSQLEIVQTCVPVNNDVATAGLVRKQREIMSLPFGIGQTRAEENEALIAELGNGRTGVFTTQTHLILWSDSAEELDDAGRKASEILGRDRVVASVETRGAPLAWFGRIPGNNELHRPLKLTNDNVAALWCFPKSPRGMENSPWGAGPVRVFPTPSGMTYQFQFHVSDRPQSRGHYLVFAPTGSGKSTLIMHLLGGLARLRGVRSFVFDSNEGARFMVERMGGLYQSFERLELNPLDVDGDGPGTRNTLRMIMKGMVGPDPEEDTDEGIARAIQMALELPREERTFERIFALAFPSGSALRRRMARWVTDERGNRGVYAHVFNARRDALGALLRESFLLGINMNEILRDAELGPPVVAHMAEAIRRSTLHEDTKGFAIFIDEAANLLQNPDFARFAVEMFREYRKLNGVVGMAFQDPGALTHNPLGESLIENAATLIFYPNPQGSPRAYEAFQLNEEQLRFVFEGAPGMRRPVMVVKRDAASGTAESAMVDVDLSPLGAGVLRHYRSGVDANRTLMASTLSTGEQ